MEKKTSHFFPVVLVTTACSLFEWVPSSPFLGNWMNTVCLHVGSDWHFIVYPVGWDLYTACYTQKPKDALKHNLCMMSYFMHVIWECCTLEISTLHVLCKNQRMFKTWPLTSDELLHVMLERCTQEDSSNLESWCMQLTFIIYKGHYCTVWCIYMPKDA